MIDKIIYDCGCIEKELFQNISGAHSAYDMQVVVEMEAAVRKVQSLFCSEHVSSAHLLAIV